MKTYIAIAATILILALLPAIGANPYTLHIYSLIGIYAIVAMGLNLVFGYAGQISLGHAAYFAVGAYVSALTTIDLGLPFWIGLLFAGIAAFILGYIVGTPSLKLEGSYLGMATIGFGEIVKMTLVNWEVVTRGPTGISRIPHPAVFGYSFNTPTAKYYLVLAIGALAFLVYWNLIRSHFGSRFIAVRDSPKATAAMGIDLQRTKVLAFAISTTFAGIGGSLYAHLNRYIAPDAFGLGESINLLIMTVIGGMGTLTGPLVGAVIVVYLRETLTMLKDYNMLIYGLLLMILMIFVPRGLVGTAALFWRRS
ncbi:branched-chain amino acid ABC transporter permease [Ferrovibrio sp.]|uniref:branched-chain amino acid ABC transporter permease n=1 Tax=Ferrovibrio sp. TaxID=1917215 RepID=UPI003D2B9326